MRRFARTLSVAPLTYLVRRGDSAAFVVFRFKTPDDAGIRRTFSGEMLLVNLQR